MPKRLASKLILSLTLIVIVVGGVAGYVNVKTQERQLLDTMILGADQLSRGITSATWQAMLADQRQAAYEVMLAVARQQGISKVRIFNREGTVMISSRPEETGSRVGRQAEVCSVCHVSAEPRSVVDPGSRSRAFLDTDGRRKLAMATPIYNEPSCSQAACHAHPSSLKVLGVLDVELELEPVDREVARLQLRMLLVTGVQIVSIGALIIVFTRRFVTVPIRRLIEGTRAVAQMNLDRPIEIDSTEELGQLAKSFDRMREQLASAVEENERFTQVLETKVVERTEQLKAAQQKLIQADRLASLGQLAASVAHEINNPLSGVLNLSMLMQRILKDDGIPRERIPEYRKFLSQVISETSRVGRIVSDLLAFSRRSKSQSTVEDLNELIRKTATLVAHKFKLAEVELDLDLDRDLPGVQCDGSQIQQVIMNLVINGADAAHGRSPGKVRVRTTVDPAGKNAVLEVRDNGEGIPPEIVARIFDPFFTTKVGKGVGLGLSVVYGIVKAHTGDIEVSSRPGEGTLFRVTLPLSAEGGTPPAAVGGPQG